MDHGGRRSSRHGELLLSLLVLLGNVHVTSGEATATTPFCSSSRRPSAAFVASNTRFPGTTRHYHKQHRNRQHHQRYYMVGDAYRRRSWSVCGRLCLLERLPMRLPNIGRTRSRVHMMIMAAVDEHEQLQQQHAQQLHEQQHEQQRFSELGQGSISRSSFVQAAAGSSAVAVLALSLVSCIRYGSIRECVQMWVIIAVQPCIMHVTRNHLIILSLA